MMASGPEQQADDSGLLDDQREQESSMVEAPSGSSNPVPPSIIIVPSSSSSDSSEGLFDSAPAPRHPRRPSKRRDRDHDIPKAKLRPAKRAPPVSPSPSAVLLCAGQYGNADMLKAKLKELHPQCFPRVRSTCGPEGRHIRFNCKNEKVAPHFCTLNVSAVKTIRSDGGSWINASIESYRPGSCGLICCCSCALHLATDHFMCNAGHKLCTGCFNSMVVQPQHLTPQKTNQ